MTNKMMNPTTKNELRKSMSNRRNLLTEEEIQQRSGEIFWRLLSLELLNSKRSVLTYVNYKSEVNTSFLIDYCLRHKISVYTPKVTDSHMDFYQITSYKDLKPGAFGILEPVTSDRYTADAKDIIIMPGLVFDTDGHRLGYGGGYYDRYLSRYQHLLKIAVCYDFQIISTQNIPFDIYDIKPDMIITDNRILPVSS